MDGELLINSGSDGVPYDGDPRASFMILEDGEPSIRRLEYHTEQELKLLAALGLSGADRTARMLRTSSLQML